MLRKLVLFATWSLILVAATGCGLLGLTSQTPTNEKSRIEETLRVLAAAGEREDIETLKAHIADAIVAEVATRGIAPLSQAPQSQENIVAMVQNFWNDVTIERVVLDPTDVRLAGDTATAQGQFTIVYSDANGDEAICSGTGEVAFVKDGAQWVVTRVYVTSSDCDIQGSVIPGDGIGNSGAPQHYFDSLGYFVVGMTDPQVKAIQESLNFLGYDVGLVDGYYGPRTEAAVRAFQKDAGIYVDGEFGPKSADAMDKALAAKGGFFKYGVAASRPASPPAGATVVTESFLRKGTIYQTSVYTYQSANPGPTLVFLGCIHGNERSGHLALVDAIDQGITIDRGRLVIIPEFNKRACAANRRTLTSDYNRMFPVGKTPTTNIAREMWSLIRSQPDLAMVIDFHDGFVNSLGNTLIHTHQAKAGTVARKVRDRLNAMRPSGATGPRWRAFTEPIGGSLTRKVGRDLGIPAMEVEISGRNPGDPLSLRKRYAWEVIKAVGEEFGMKISF